MSTINEREATQRQIMYHTFPVGKVVRAFVGGSLQWELGRVMEIDRKGPTGEPTGLVVCLLADRTTLSYPFSVIAVGEESFIAEVSHEDVVREIWPIGQWAMVKLVGHDWKIATVARHTEQGIGVDSNLGPATFWWKDFMDDGRCSELKRIRSRYKP